MCALPSQPPLPPTHRAPGCSRARAAATAFWCAAQEAATLLVTDAVSAARVDARWCRDEARRLAAEAEKKAANDGWGDGAAGGGGEEEVGDGSDEEDEEAEDESDEGEEEEEGEGEGEGGGEAGDAGGAEARGGGDEDDGAVLVDAAPAGPPVDDEFERMFMKTMTDSIEQRKAAARVSGVTGDNMILPSSVLPKAAGAATAPVNGCAHRHRPPARPPLRAPVRVCVCVCVCACVASTRARPSGVNPRVRQVHDVPAAEAEPRKDRGDAARGAR